MLEVDQKITRQETQGESEVIVSPKMSLSINDPSGKTISIQKVRMTKYAPSLLDPVAKKTDQLLGIKYSFEKEKEQKELNDDVINHYIFLIDISASMHGPNEQLVKEIFLSIWERMQQCSDNSRITIMGFNHEVKRIKVLQKLEELKKELEKDLHSLFRQLTTEGSTRIDKAVEEMLDIYEQGKQKNLNTVDQVFLFTDGRNDLGAKSTEDLKKLFRQKNYPLNVTCLGIGSNYDHKYVVGLLDGTPWFHVKSSQEASLDGAVLNAQLMSKPVSASLSIECPEMRAEAIAETKITLNSPTQLFLEYDQLVNQGLSEELLKAVFEAKSIEIEVKVNETSSISKSNVVVSNELGFYSPNALTYFRARIAELDRTYILNDNKLDKDSTECVYRLFRQIPYTVESDYALINQDKFGISENHPNSTFLGCKPNTHANYCEMRKGLFSLLAETRTREEASASMTSSSGFRTGVSNSSLRNKNLKTLKQADIEVVDPVSLDDFTDLDGKKFAVPYVVVSCDKRSGETTLLPQRLSRATIEGLKNGSGIENLPLSPYAQGNRIYLIVSARDEPFTNYLKGRTSKEIQGDKNLLAKLPSNTGTVEKPAGGVKDLLSTLRALTMFRNGNAQTDEKQEVTPIAKI